MTLDNKNQSLEVKLSGAVTTNQLTLVCSYADPNIFGKQTVRTVTNGATAVKLLPAPLMEGATARELKTASIQNTDTVAATVTVRLNDNGTFAPIYVVTLQPNDTLFYELNRGWYVLDSTGGIKESTATISVNFSINEIPTGVINGSNVTFNLAHVPSLSSEMVYYNGQLQRPITDYTISGGTITFVTAPETGTSIYVSYRY